MADLSSEPVAWFGDRVARGLLEVSDDPGVLDSGGCWAVCLTYEGQLAAARFERWEPLDPAADARGHLAGLLGQWRGPDPAAWTPGLEQHRYEDAVSAVRARIAAGDVYQANICRVMRARIPDPARADVLALAMALQRGNPAPYAGALRLPEHGLAVACASPELFLRRSRAALSSKPIKGTGRTARDLLDKDFAENVMIVDLVRNDLAQVCQPGSVQVPGLLVIESHPGLVHLVSEVSGHLRPGVGWPEILSATFPPGSVTGAPKASAMSIIAELEAGPRGPYCGAFGWVDADAGTARLAVAIRTFWVEPGASVDPGDGPVLCFGAGAGITWGSEPRAEWHETLLKARRLVAVAAGSVPPRQGEGDEVLG